VSYYRVEHLHEPELTRLPEAIFGHISPQLVIMTTPNAEFNVLFPNPTAFRHPDHKFEWTRQQFGDWYLLCPFHSTLTTHCVAYQFCCVVHLSSQLNRDCV